MGNPYSNRPDYIFWKRSVATPPSGAMDPVISVPFTLNPADAIATAGSCFAQHISSTLVREGFNYLVTETAPPSSEYPDENYGTFPARFGNIYTVRQLKQLFKRAYSAFRPATSAWQRLDGAYVDPFRPLIQKSGFPTLAALAEDGKRHLAAVRRMFESCDVFIFTLGLTEGWVAAADGAVVPLAPGVVNVDLHDYEFKNFSVPEMVADFKEFIDDLRMVNPQVKLIITVSPVPLIATFEDRHVLVSNTYSKSALRVVAEMIMENTTATTYFPAYEIITGPHARYGYYEDDLRSVTKSGVDHVMRIFSQHFLGGDKDQRLVKKTIAEASPVRASVAAASVVTSGAAASSEYAEIANVICDEEAITGGAEE